MSFQVNFMSEDSNNRKGDHDLGLIILQTRIVFWCTGKQEEGILGF